MITTVQSSAISIAADRIQAGSLGINYIFLYFQEFLRFLCSSPVDQVKLLIHSPFMVKSNNTLAIMILQKMPLDENFYSLCLKFQEERWDVILHLLSWHL